jgi:hypothetical protein
MRNSLPRSALLCLLPAPITAGCVLPPGPGSSTPPGAQVAEAGVRALAYGRSAGEILENPQLRDQVCALTRGSDGNPYPRSAP